MNLLRTLLFCLLLSPAWLPAADLSYEPLEGWLKPAPDLKTIGNAHGDVAVSSNGDVYVSIIGGPHGGIQVFDAQGKYLRNVPNAPNDFHGFVIHQEAGGEFIYGTRLSGQSIIKMQLDGKIVLQVPADMFPVELKNERNGKKFLRLTAVDVAPDGRIFAVDGYSTDMIHIFDTKGKYLDSFGGKKAPYSFKTLHKIAIDTRYEPPRIIGVDRENRRVVQLSLDGEVLGIAENLMRPAAVVIQGDLAVVAEIEGRVSFLDKDLKPVHTLGENSVKEHTATNKVPPEKWIPGELMAPHGLDFAPNGDLLVTEYNKFGRVVRYASQE